MTARRVSLLLLLLSPGCATFFGPSAEVAGPSTLETDALGRASRRNLIAGETILIAGGGALGLTSGGLLIAGAVRDCPEASPKCNDTLKAVSNYVGAASIVVTAVGIVFYAIGYTQKRVVQKLRGQRHGP